MKEASQTLLRETCADSRSVIFSQESPAGRKPLDAPESPQLDLFGQALAPARTTVAPVREKAWKVKETYGRTSFGSSASAVLNESLANRLKLRLDTVGSTVYLQTWKRKVTPLGRSYWAHTARAGTTSGKDCTGWVTPQVKDFRSGQLSRWEKKEHAVSLNDQAMVLDVAQALKPEAPCGEGDHPDAGVSGPVAHVDLDERSLHG